MRIHGKIVGSIAGATPDSDAEHERTIDSEPAVVAAPMKDFAQDVPFTGLHPSQEAAIRQRIVEGAYDALEIVDQVARRILESGDL